MTHDSVRIPEAILGKLDADSGDFLRRMYEKPLDRYDRRLKAIGFEGVGRVLDAGCGFGQWTHALARLNAEAHGVDVNSARLLVAESLARQEGIGNAHFRIGSLDKTGYPDAYFDAVFCYGAIFYTDEAESLKEFSRVLKPGGKLYVTFNSWGTYLYFLIEKGIKESQSFYLKDARTAFMNSFTGRRSGSHVISPGRMRSLLRKNGFTDIDIRKDGEIRQKGAKPVTAFFRPTYLGFDTLFESLASKK